VKVRIDKDFRDLIPPLAPEERSQLESNILRDGCRDPIVLWDGWIVDGHNRYDICTTHKLEFSTKGVAFKSRQEAKIWIIDNQSGRRNISDIDRIALQQNRAAIVKEIVDAQARTAKSEAGKTGGRGNKRMWAKLPTSFTCNCGERFDFEVWHCRSCGSHWKVDQKKCKTCDSSKGLKTRNVLAKAAGVGERTYDAGKIILDAAAKGEITPDIIEDVRRGRKAIHRVAKDITEKRQSDSRKAKREEAAKSSIACREIIVGDFREHAAKVADGSVSLIFTDPPYDQKALQLFDGLAEFAAAKLCEGGSLICYLGQLQLPVAMQALARRLRYWWTIACVHSGRTGLIKEYGIRNHWKPVLWFVKGTRENKTDIVADVMSGGEEKSDHEWQQALSEAEYWISELCPADGIVVDPFLGSGTTALAAKSLGRKWVGFEIDRGTAANASKRIVG
jgi:hypothetical protein